MRLHQPAAAAAVAVFILGTWYLVGSMLSVSCLKTIREVGALLGGIYVLLFCGNCVALCSIMWRRCCGDCEPALPSGTAVVSRLHAHRPCPASCHRDAHSISTCRAFTRFSLVSNPPRASISAQGVSYRRRQRCGQVTGTERLIRLGVRTVTFAAATRNVLHLFVAAARRLL